MQNRLVKKEIVIGIIILFVGGSITSSIGKSIEKQSDMYNSKYQMQQFITLGEPPEEQWNKTYGGWGNDSGLFVNPISDDGYIIAGQYEQNQNSDFWLIRTDGIGNMMWASRYDKGFTDFAISAFETTDGGFIAAGTTVTVDSFSGDVWLIKTDADGLLMWEYTIDLNTLDIATCMINTSDGGYIITGITWVLTDDSDVMLIKLGGSSQWIQIIGDSEDEWANAVIETDDGGFMVTGHSYENPNDSDLFLIKTDVNGSMQWKRTYGGSEQDKGYSLLQEDDGGYVIVGNYTSEKNEYYCWLIKTDSNGILQWNKTYSFDYNNYGVDLLKDTDGGYLILTDINSAVGLIKTDNNGSIIWNQIYGELGKYGYMVQDLNWAVDSGYIITGSITDYTDRDVFLMKISGDGHNQAPNVPTIAGKNKGKNGKEYEYTFNASDPDDDSVMYFIDWGDNKTEWTEYCDSGEEITLKHTWSEKGDYTIKVKAKDIYDAESEWGTFDVTMPKSKLFIFNFPILSWLFERFPNVFPILRYIIGL